MDTDMLEMSHAAEPISCSKLNLTTVRKNQHFASIILMGSMPH